MHGREQPPPGPHPCLRPGVIPARDHRAPTRRARSHSSNRLDQPPALRRDICRPPIPRFPQQTRTEDWHRATRTSWSVDTSTCEPPTTETVCDSIACGVSAHWRSALPGTRISARSCRVLHAPPGPLHLESRHSSYSWTGHHQRHTRSPTHEKRVPRLASHRTCISTAWAGPRFVSERADLAALAEQAWTAGIECTGWEPTTYPEVPITLGYVGGGLAGGANFDRVGLRGITIDPEPSRRTLVHEVAHAWAYQGPIALTEGRTDRLADCIVEALDLGIPLDPGPWRQPAQHARPPLPARRPMASQTRTPATARPTSAPRASSSRRADPRRELSGHATASSPGDSWRRSWAGLDRGSRSSGCPAG